MTPGGVAEERGWEVGGLGGWRGGGVGAWGCGGGVQGCLAKNRVLAAHCDVSIFDI